MAEPQAYLNGKFLPASQVTISPGDAGFVLGATLAEQLRTFRGRLFHLEDHLERLAHSLEVVDVDPGLDRGQLADIARQLVEHNHRLLDPADDLGLSVFVTPGPYAAYAAPGPVRPTVCLHTYPLPFRLWAEKYEMGQALVTSEIEQVSPRSWPPSLKCRSRMHYYLADRQAARVDPAARAVLLDREGRVTEASTANILIYRRDEGLVSPPRETVLLGISLAVTWELARGRGLAVVQRELKREDLASADEVLLTSTPLCLLPVTRLDRRPVGSGVPGDVFGRLLAAWNELVGLDIAAQARQFAARGRPEPGREMPPIPV
jgi:branched-chain amino acid aminotransferase